MAIKGLTDRGMKLPTIGVLRKGDAKTDPKKPGKDLDYFRFDTQDAEAKAIFEATYGTKPRTIRVVLPYATLEENFEAWREDWKASSLQHRCDGQDTVLRLTKDGTYSTASIPCPGGCKQVGRLTVILPELQRFASVTVLTTSIHDILEIHGNLQALQLAKGRVGGIPLLLRRVEREISTPTGDGKRARRKKWLLSIEAQPEWLNLFLSASENTARALAMGADAPVPLQLMPKPEDDEDEGEEMNNVQALHQAVESKLAAVASATTPSPAVPTANRVAQKAEVATVPGLSAALLAWAIKEKRNEKAGKAYYDAVLAKMSAKDMEQFASEKGIRWSEGTAETEGGPLVEVADADPVTGLTFAQATQRAELTIKIEDLISKLDTAIGPEKSGKIALAHSGGESYEEFDLDQLQKFYAALSEDVGTL